MERDVGVADGLLCHSVGAGKHNVDRAGFDIPADDNPVIAFGGGKTIASVNAQVIPYCRLGPSQTPGLAVGSAKDAVRD